MSITEDSKEYLESLIQPIATKSMLEDMFETFKRSILDKLELRINEQDKKIELLESTVSLKENVIDQLLKEVEQLEEKSDDNEQYSRRSCVRINGNEYKNKGNCKNGREIIGNCFESLNLPYDEYTIYRAHRIGKTIVDDTGMPTKSIIVKFKSWDVRTNFYKARPKKMKSFSVSLDLTKRRYRLLEYSKAVVNHYAEVDFGFAYINRSLAIRLKDGSFHYFNNKKSLKDILKGI